MASEYICGLSNCSRLIAKDAERILVRANGKRVRESVGQREESICMKTDSEVTILNKVAERTLEPANGKPCQTQCRAMANEYMCGLLIGRVLTT